MTCTDQAAPSSAVRAIGSPMFATALSRPAAWWMAGVKKVAETASSTNVVSSMCRAGSRWRCRATVVASTPAVSHSRIATTATASSTTASRFCTSQGGLQPVQHGRIGRVTLLALLVRPGRPRVSCPLQNQGGDHLRFLLLDGRVRRSGQDSLYDSGIQRGQEVGEQRGIWGVRGFVGGEQVGEFVDDDVLAVQPAGRGLVEDVVGLGQAPATARTGRGEMTWPAGSGVVRGAGSRRPRRPARRTDPGPRRRAACAHTVDAAPSASRSPPPWGRLCGVSPRPAVRSVGPARSSRRSP